jgi:hypothetical protein
MNSAYRTELSSYERTHCQFNGGDSRINRFDFIAALRVLGHGKAIELDRF